MISKLFYLHDRARAYKSMTTPESKDKYKVNKLDGVQHVYWYYINESHGALVYVN